MISKWYRLVIRWAKILFGKSYYHQPLRLGKLFSADEIAGYFNDMTGKTRWTGHVDREGIPICTLADGRQVYFVTTIVQKALGHWDKWLLYSRMDDKDEFLKLCFWLLDHQDENGGWPVWKDLGIATALSPYSAMTQGQCISAFVRTWRLTDDCKFAYGASKALHLMCLPIEKGGTSIYEGENLYFEELPQFPRSTVLNGWIYALFGVYDFWISVREDRILKIFSQSLKTLREHLPEYDAGYWSYYDTKGRLASFFYHALHISQLTALSMIDGGNVFQRFRERWIAYEKCPKNRAKALVVKAFQKLREPGEVVLIP